MSMISDSVTGIEQADAADGYQPRLIRNVRRKNMIKIREEQKTKGSPTLDKQSKFVKSVGLTLLFT